MSHDAGSLNRFLPPGTLLSGIRTDLVDYWSSRRELMPTSHSTLVSRSAGSARDNEAVTMALAAVASGQPVVIAGGHDEASFGMIMLSAERATAAELLALGRLSAGWSYLALTDERCAQLGLTLVASDDGSVERAPVTATIRARGLGSDVDMSERARTIRVAIDPSTRRDALLLGGHVVPLRGRPGGVFGRAGHTEAALDLARLAGVNPSAVLVELVNSDSSSMRGAEVVDFARENGMPLLTIGDLIEHRRRTERIVERVAAATISTPGGPYLAVGYLCRTDGGEHLAMVRGEVDGRASVPVHVHPACWQGDVFRSLACDCAARLDAARAVIEHAGHGVILHIAHPGYHHHDVHPAADWRAVAQMLVDLGIASVRLLPDDPDVACKLDGYGVVVADRCRVRQESRSRTEETGYAC